LPLSCPAANDRRGPPVIPNPWPSQTQARVRLPPAPAVCAPSHAWPARQGGLPAFISRAATPRVPYQNPRRRPEPQAESLEPKIATAAVLRRRCYSAAEVPLRSCAGG
jgi:hypothetical protein